jgi:ribosome modulation factor
MSTTCFLNVGLGQWYSTGSDRLKGSLIDKGFDGDMLIWKDEWPSNRFPRDCVYAVKADAMETAMKRGYTTLIWGDSSIYARKNTSPFTEHIRQHGYWIGQSGYRASETATDAQLQYFGVSRDWAHEIPDCATGLFGFDVSRPEYRAVVEQWIQAAKDGAFRGPRNHGGGSQDRRYKHGRQDQAAMSLLLGKHGVVLQHFISMARFAWDKQDTIFHCQGM